jgi:exonuclease SbcD
MSRVAELAKFMPVVIINGTFSHDRPGSIDVFSYINERYHVHVIDEPTQMHIVTANGEKCLVNCLPSLNKAMPEISDAGGPAEWVAKLLSNWAETNKTHRQNGGCSILVSHGTVVGCKTESGHAMVSPDHEFSCETLISSGVDAVMLGHIHLHQSWEQLVCYGKVVKIAYPGSIAKLVFGHIAPTGFLMWEVSPEYGEFEFIPAPSPEMVEIIFDGKPDMEKLQELAATIPQGAMVRIRSQVDEEYAQFVDRAAIAAMFAGTEKFSLDLSITPVQIVRAPGIGKHTSVRGRL